MWKYTLVVMALWLAQTGQSVAQNMNASSVMMACGTPEDAWINFCNGYVQAIVDAANATGVEICPPATTTRATIAGEVFRGLIFLKESAGQNAMDEQDGATAVISILRLNYPCT